LAAAGLGVLFCLPDRTRCDKLTICPLEFSSVDRITRHDLKTDQFAQQVGHIVEEVEAHRSQVIRYGVAAVAAVVLIVGAVWFVHSRKESREQELAKVLRIWNAPIGAPGGGEYAFADAPAKEKAFSKATAEIISVHPGSDQAGVAEYLLAIRAADQGKLDVAERNFKQAIEDGGSEYGALAKLALADVYVTQGKAADAEKLLKSLIDKPTVLVSKDQATIALARIYVKTRPAEAHKLVQPLLTQTTAVGRIAMSLFAETNPTSGR
jgi:predicted negative regulator of RcsB-dependent stress response